MQTRLSQPGLKIRNLVALFLEMEVGNYRATYRDENATLECEFINEPGSKLPLLYSSKEGCSMSRDVLKPLQNDTGHPKKRYPKTIPPRPAKRYGAP